MSSAFRAVLRALPLLVAFLAPRGACAEGSDAVTAHLDWRQTPGAETCVDSEALKHAVNQRFRRTVFVESARADILLHGVVARLGPHRWSAALGLARADGSSLGSRELVTEAPDCSSLDDSIALAVGLMLDVSRHRIVEERRLGGRRSDDAAPAPVDGPAIVIPKETAPGREVFRAEPSLGVEAAAGVLPGLGFGVRPGVVLVPPRFVPVELAGTFFLPDEEHAANGRGARFSAVSVELSFCPFGLRRGPFRADAWLTERFGQIRGVGFGFAETETATEFVSAVGVREVASVKLAGPLALFLGVGAEASFIRYRFLFGGADGGARTIYRMPPVSGSGTLGLFLAL